MGNEESTMQDQEWFKVLNDRDQKRIKFALLYDTDEFRHGANGHNDLMLISRLATLVKDSTDTIELLLSRQEKQY